MKNWSNNSLIKTKNTLKILKLNLSTTNVMQLKILKIWEWVLHSCYSSMAGDLKPSWLLDGWNTQKNNSDDRVSTTIATTARSFRIAILWQPTATDELVWQGERDRGSRRKEKDEEFIGRERRLGVLGYKRLKKGERLSGGIERSFRKVGVFGLERELGA